MDRSEKVKKIKLKSLHVRQLVNLLNKLKTLKPSERLNYFKNISKSEIKLISEIIHNFLKFNIKSDLKSLSISKRMNKLLYKLSSKRVSYLVKKQLLQTLKGLNILNLIIPLALNTLSE